MAISIEEVRKLASLSRISLSPEEEVSMQQEIGSILGYVEQIKQINLDDKEKENTERKNIWREDIDAHESGAYTEKLLSNAPSREGNYVKVKKIL